MGTGYFALMLSLTHLPDFHLALKCCAALFSDASNGAHHCNELSICPDISEEIVFWWNFEFT